MSLDILFCDPERIRTFDLRLRRALLYPAELRSHNIYFNRTRCAILPTFRESYGAIIFISIGLVALSYRRFGRATEPFIFKTKKGMIAHPLSVGAAGFEPATSWSQTRRDDRTTLRPEFVFQVFLNNLRKIRSF
jgi:hypothetical protein